jgi:hypothetical protein
MSCKRHRENPEMDSKVPIGLLTSSDIHPTIEGAIEEVKFFQLGFIICKRKEKINW